MRKLSKKGIIGIIIAAVVVIIIAVIAIIMGTRIDSEEAKRIALAESGGGEITQQEISHEGLWNEYSYTIINGEKWYEIEIGGFGDVQELQSGTGPAPID